MADPGGLLPSSTSANTSQATTSSNSNPTRGNSRRRGRQNGQPFSRRGGLSNGPMENSEELEPSVKNNSRRVQNNRRGGNGSHNSEQHGRYNNRQEMQTGPSRSNHEFPFTNVTHEPISGGNYQYQGPHTAVNSNFNANAVPFIPSTAHHHPNESLLPPTADRTRGNHSDRNPDMSNRRGNRQNRPENSSRGGRGSYQVRGAKPPIYRNMPPNNEQDNGSRVDGTGFRGRGNRRGQNKRGGVNLRTRGTRQSSCDQDNSNADLGDRPQRERLTQELENNNYECTICYQRVTSKQGVWSCKTCYHVFHISNGCIINWAKSSREKEEDNKWRCPMCNTANEKMPYTYYCFCGKQRNPTYQLGETPHSCGSVCEGGRKHGCPHKCTDICHPGPCWDCLLQVMQPCNCGKVTKPVRCGSGVTVNCESKCDKPLSCGKHTCQRVCHKGDCDDCDVLVDQECSCGREHREVVCSSDLSEKYNCGNQCDGLFDCGIHKCTKICHEQGENCGECSYSTNRIKNCPCGKMTLKEIGVARQSCSDAIPTCQNTCDKMLDCGSAGKSHRCQSKCHEGPCPPCRNNTGVVCRCGGTKKSMPCDEYLEILRAGNGEYLCEKRCKKKKSCGLHKCQEACCIQVEHFCMQMCNKKLSCGIHNCENICHAGQCQRCLQANFDEQFCYCGKTVRLPPIACGSSPPPCSEKCTRTHVCDHPVTHNCHSEHSCPPCTYLTNKWCYGNHEMRRNIPCHMAAISCGRSCGKELACKIHTCVRSCHGEECEKAGEDCKQLCSVTREGCEHPCALPCHGEELCKPSLCKQKVEVTCTCGRRKAAYACWEVDRLLKLRDDQEKQKHEEGKEMASPPGALKRTSSMTQLNCMECDEECKKLTRNRKIAEALDIEVDEGGDTMLSPTISYSQYLKTHVKTSLEFVKFVENTIRNALEALSDPTKIQDTLCVHLQPMGLERRRFIHEYAHYFKVDSESVDVAPKRSVILTVRRGKTHPPLVLLSDLIHYKKVLNTPGPSIIRKDYDEGSKKIAPVEEGGMRPLVSVERFVYRRDPKPLPKLVVANSPVKQSNAFAALLSDESEGEEESVGKEKEDGAEEGPSEPVRDWWSEDEADGGWKKILPVMKRFSVEEEEEEGEKTPEGEETEEPAGEGNSNIPEQEETTGQSEGSIQPAEKDEWENRAIED